jgi:hypothetical protein
MLIMPCMSGSPHSRAKAFPTSERNDSPELRRTHRRRCRDFRCPSIYMRTHMQFRTCIIAQAIRAQANKIFFRSNYASEYAAGSAQSVATTFDNFPRYALAPFSIVWSGPRNGHPSGLGFRISVLGILEGFLDLHALIAGRRVQQHLESHYSQFESRRSARLAWPGRVGETNNNQISI